MICLCKHACCPFASVSSYSGLTDVHAQDLLLLPAISNFGFMVSQDQQTTLQSSHQDAQQQSLMSVPICPAVMPQENTINCGAAYVCHIMYGMQRSAQPPVQVQAAVAGSGWSHVPEDVLRALQAPHFERKQQDAGEDTAAGPGSSATGASPQLGCTKRALTVKLPRHQRNIPRQCCALMLCQSALPETNSMPAHQAGSTMTCHARSAHLQDVLKYAAQTY